MIVYEAYRLWLLSLSVEDKYNNLFTAFACQVVIFKSVLIEY